ncbi:hypothetical protein CEXT_464181 [Caerostris extrusa]|uniref:Uncharacterized protein n=1 Tax=Caerostris extrusa TaxID=172846 RepID=A0AAV4RA95_CAEEX|nr:hypothetical protein CEXT_464181 [Caerostris extrusa]
MVTAKKITLKQNNNNKRNKHSRLNICLPISASERDCGAVEAPPVSINKSIQNAIRIVTLQTEVDRVLFSLQTAIFKETRVELFPVVRLG